MSDRRDPKTEGEQALERLRAERDRARMESIDDDIIEVPDVEEEQELREKEEKFEGSRGNKKQKSFRKLRQNARQDDEVNLDRLRWVRDNPESSPGDVMRAVKELNEIAYDKPGSRPADTDTSSRPVIRIRLPKEQLESYRQILIEDA